MLYLRHLNSHKKHISLMSCMYMLVYPWHILSTLYSHSYCCTNVMHYYHVPYSGKLSWEKVSRIGENKSFTKKTFAACSLGATKNAMPPNFVEKTFTDSHKTSKFTKIFSLKSIPLWGVVLMKWEAYKTKT